MAVVRARSSPPYALIIFIFLWVVSTALAVVFYMQFDKATKEQEKAEHLSRQVVKPGEQELVNQFLLGQSGPNAMSALGVAYKQIQDLKLTVAGPDAGNQSIDEIKGLVKQALVKAKQSENISLLQAVHALTDNITKLTSDNTALNDKATAEKAAYDSALDQFKAAEKSANDSIDQGKDEIKKVSDEVASANADKATLASQYEKTLTSVKDAAEADRRQHVLELDQKDNTIKLMTNKIATLEQALSNLRPTAKMNVGREPDGVIVRTNIGDGDVYINLGRKDHVLPGLTFAVYDPKLGVRVDDEQEAQGKGGIEVLEVGDNESLCRITKTTKGQTMQSGDLIANPVYNSDKNRKYHFVVFGDFDLDGDGQATSQERDRIVRMIQTWGGIVDNTISTQTDFLVIGGRPAAPNLNYEGSDEAGSIAKAQEDKQQQYDDIIKEAKSSSVPILNQNRFLAMIGYYNTTIVHH